MEFQTTYHRAEPVTKDDTSVADSDEKGEKLSNNIAGDAASVEQQNYGPPPSWRSELKIYHGSFSKENFLKIFLRPFPFLLSPVVRGNLLYVSLTFADRRVFDRPSFYFWSMGCKPFG